MPFAVMHNTNPFFFFLSGAFYIRRSFGHDQLYWAVVSQYIQYHIVNFQAPIEFFLEGTRSRNGKSLPPKTGKTNCTIAVCFTW